MNQKGFFDFISALKLLSKSVLECFEVTIVGSGSEKKRLIDYAGNLANVTFIDHLSHDETLNCLLKSDLVVLPSRYEGLSMFALEGLATGNAVIFSKTGGLVDLVEQNGLFFEPQNIEDLAKSLTVFSQYTDQEIKEMKINSLSIIDKKFSAQVVAGSLMQVINLCSSSSSL